MKVYLAGPMTGYPEKNYPAFVNAAAWLREVGYAVVSPAEVNPDLNEGTWQECMKKDIHELLACECVVVLPGWQNSEGATLEVNIARAMSMPIMQLTVALNAQLASNRSGRAPSGDDYEAMRVISNAFLTEHGWISK